MTTTPDESPEDPAVTPDGDASEESLESQHETVKAAKRATEAAGKERPQDQADDAISPSQGTGDDVRDTFKD